MAEYVVGLVMVVVAWFGWMVWETRARYGPLCYGNARWRREAPARAAASERLALLRALTDEDREWLLSMGWRARG